MQAFQAATGPNQVPAVPELPELPAASSEPELPPSPELLVPPPAVVPASSPGAKNEHSSAHSGFVTRSQAVLALGALTLGAGSQAFSSVTLPASFMAQAPALLIVARHAFKSVELGGLTASPCRHWSR